MRRLATVFLLVALVAATAAGQTWVQRVLAFSTVLGDALSPNPLKTTTIYGAPGGRQLYVSRDRGATWHTFGVAVVHVGNNLSENVIKSIAVDPLDTNRFVIGVESNNEAYDRILRSTDGGMSWTQTWGGTFEFFGKPVEFKPYHPDTLWTMGNDTLWRSTNFGATWDTVRTTTGLFAAWCDAEVRRDSANVMFLGDFSSGIWKSYDYGKHWKNVYLTNGEIPSIAIDPFNPRRMYASKYSGGGGIIGSTDWGETWQQLNTPISPSGSSAGGPGWWVTCSQRDTGYVYFGVYTTVPGGIFVSADSGGTWRHFLTGFDDPGKVNYGILAVDTLSVVALQYNGIWRLAYTPKLHLLSPAGGNFRSGTTAHISWGDTSVYTVRIDYSTNAGGSWNLIADSLPASQHSLDWSVPALTSSQCLLRLSSSDPSPAADTSGYFTIYENPLVLASPVGGERWDALSLHDIRWNAFAIDTVRIEFSPDSGATWSDVATVGAGPGRYRWSVPQSVSERCLVRISSPSDTTAVRISPSTFAIQQTAQFRSRLVVRDNGAGLDTLVWGNAAGATDSIDAGEGEIPLGGLPPSGTFDARWILPAGGGETTVDIRDTLGGTVQSRLFTLRLQPGAGGFPMVLRWNPDSIHSGTCILRDAATGGRRLRTDMRVDSVMTIADTGVALVEILQCRSVKAHYGDTPDWSMISVPSVTGFLRTASLFPSAYSRAFLYEGGYKGSDSLELGTGYWIRTAPTDIFGCACAAETVAVGKGWNMIGGPTAAVGVGTVTTEPASILASPFFGYGGGYFVADSLQPGRGYWIKTGAAGSLIVSSSPAAVPQSTRSISAILGTSDRLVFDDGCGGAQTLYLSHAEETPEESYFEAPPDLPEKKFRASFAGGTILKKILQNQTNSQELSLIVRSAENEKNSINLAWDVDNEGNFNYILLTKVGDKTVSSTELQGRGRRSFPFSSTTTFALKIRQPLSSTVLPRIYSLGRMYPNPFNPTTSFRYSVPEEARVDIRVYSSLGEEVTRLVDRAEPPGEYEVRWDGTNRGGGHVASGVYFFRMKATSLHGAAQPFTAVERAVLLK